MNRIDLVFKGLKEKQKKALIPFITCGDPSLEDTIKMVLSLEKEGADIIELGVPFSDPLADGAVIQESYIRALRNGFKVSDLFKCGKAIREKSDIPLVVMIYYNLVYTRGIEKFIKEAREVGFDGIIIPDIPLEEREEVLSICEENEILLIPLVAPTSKDRIKKIIKDSKGFVYCVSSNGTTGERDILGEELNSYLSGVRKEASIPLCLGFGISSVEVVRKVKEICDGVIIGSAVVRRIKEDKEEALSFIRSINLEL